MIAFPRLFAFPPEPVEPPFEALDPAQLERLDPGALGWYFAAAIGYAARGRDRRWYALARVQASASLLAMCAGAMLGATLSGALPWQAVVWGALPALLVALGSNVRWQRALRTRGRESGERCEPALAVTAEITRRAREAEGETVLH